MRFPAYKVVTVLCLASMLIVGEAQQVAPLSNHGIRVKHQAEALLSGTVVSVFLTNGKQKEGQFLSARPTTLTFYDAATKADVEVGYDSVRTIKQGKQRSRHRHAVFVIVVSVIAGVAIGSFIAGK